MEDDKRQVETQEVDEKSTEQKPAIDEKQMRSALAGHHEDQDFEMPKAESDEPGDNEPPQTPPNEGASEDGGEGGQENQEKSKAPESGKQENQMPNLVTKKMWDRVKGEYEQQFGEGTFPMPEDINEENEVDVFLDFYSKIIEPDLGDIPEEAKEIINLHKQGKYNSDEFFGKRSSSTDLKKLPDEEFLFRAYKNKNGKSEQNPTGWTDEDIRDFLSKKSKIELHELAENGRAQLEQQEAQQKEKREELLQQKRDKEFEFIQNQKIETAKKVVNQHKNTRSFLGILELSPEEKAQYDKDFVEMLKMDKKTGMHKLGELLNDDSLIYEIGALLWKGKGGLKGYISNIKESVKKETEEKLDPKLEETRGTTKLAQPVNRERLI